MLRRWLPDCGPEYLPFLWKIIDVSENIPDPSDDYEFLQAKPRDTRTTVMLWNLPNNYTWGGPGVRKHSAWFVSGRGSIVFSTCFCSKAIDGRELTESGDFLRRVRWPRRHFGVQHPLLQVAVSSSSLCVWARRASRASSIFCIFLSILGQDMSWPREPGCCSMPHGAMVRSKAGLGYAFVNLCDPSFAGVLRSSWGNLVTTWRHLNGFVVPKFGISGDLSNISSTGPEMSRILERWATGRFRGATILEDFRRLYQMGAHLQLWRTIWKTTVVMVACSSRTSWISLGISGDPGPPNAKKMLP